jgi:hypothetical protein
LAKLGLVLVRGSQFELLEADNLQVELFPARYRRQLELFRLRRLALKYLRGRQFLREFLSVRKLNRHWQ